MSLDLITIYSIVKYFLLMYVGTVTTIVILMWILSYMGNPYAVEFSSLVGLLLYLCIELMLGLFSLEWTLPILVTVAPLVVRETLHPTSKHVTKYELLESNEDEKQSGMLCFWNGQEYSAMAAISITSIPIETLPLVSMNLSFSGSSVPS